MLTENEIGERLEQASLAGPRTEFLFNSGMWGADPHLAAVLIPFLQKPDGWHLLYIRRTVAPKDRHSGQVAFPGGRCEAEDANAIRAALREAQEEVGIHPSDVRVLGKVQEMLTITNYLVTPVIGAIPWPYEFRPQVEEVARIFTIPLNWLANPTNREVQMHRLKLLGKDLPVIYFKEFDGEILWGVSARITVMLLEALGLATPQSDRIAK